MKIRKSTNNGKPCWVLEIGYRHKRRHRKYYATHTAAQNALVERRTMAKRAGDFWVGLEPWERIEAAEVIAKCKAAGTTLRGLWDSHVKKTGVDVRLTSLADAPTATLSAKKLENSSERYIEGLESYLKMFIKGREDAPISDITTDDVERWFEKRNESPSSRASNIGRLSAMFSLAKVRKWLLHNPCDAVIKPKIVRGGAEILTVRQVARALVWTRRHKPSMLAYLSLSLFAGVRPEELEVVDWKCIKESGDATVLVIGAEASKVHTRRVLKLHPTAIRWMEIAKDADSDLPVSASTRKRYIRQLKTALWMNEWTQDILRHTAANHMLALKHDAAAVALDLGNSPAILLRHYRALVSDQETKRFWSLCPSKHC